MKKPIQQWPTRYTLLGTLSLLVLSFVLTGCGNDSPVEQIAEAVIAEPAAAMEEEAVVEEEMVETAVEPTEEPVIDECLSCHIDKEMLIDTADPVVEVISESEGEG